MRKFPRIPHGAACFTCGESIPECLRPMSAGIQCFNCADTRHKRRGECALCELPDVPIEVDHIYMRPHPDTWEICLCCHRFKSTMECRMSRERPYLTPTERAMFAIQPVRYFRHEIRR